MTAIPYTRFDAPHANNLLRGFRGSMGMVRDWLDPDAVGPCATNITFVLSGVDAAICTGCYQIANVASHGVDRWMKFDSIAVDDTYTWDFSDMTLRTLSVVPSPGSPENDSVQCVFTKTLTSGPYVTATEYTNSGCTTASGTSYTWEELETEFTTDASFGACSVDLEAVDTSAGLPSYARERINPFDTTLDIGEPGLARVYQTSPGCGATAPHGTNATGFASATGSITKMARSITAGLILRRPGTAAKLLTQKIGIRPCGGCEKRAQWMDDRADDLKRFIDRVRPAGVHHG